MKPITLFDARVNKICRGSVRFIRKESRVASEFIDNLKWLEQRYRPNPYLLYLKSKKLFLYHKFAIACFILASIGFSSLLLPIAAAEINYRISSLFPKKTIPESTAPLTAYNQIVQRVRAAEIAETEVPVVREFKIQIPKINVESEVIPNVDPTNEEEYVEKLKLGVAHAKGSYLPGDNGTIVLFSHSTDTPANILQYNAKFYAAKDLEKGDEIQIQYNGKLYKYVIQEKNVIAPNDLEAIRGSSADLILQTCWPPGTNWNRLLVFAKALDINY